MEKITKTFVADGSGNEISFRSTDGNLIVDGVSLRKVDTASVDGNVQAKEFLVGNTDEGREINFRVDTHIIQLMSEFETFAIPVAVIAKLQRGSLLKCFVALGDDDFYELEGNATKGTSLVKVHSQNRSEVDTPPVTREIRISWRDSSKQLCRLTQGGVIFLPTTMNYTE